MPKVGGATRGRGRRDVGEYPLAADLARPVGRVGMPRLARLSRAPRLLTGNVATS